jgi:AraC-like DNA-binding protein
MPAQKEQTPRILVTFMLACLVREYSRTEQRERLTREAIRIARREFPRQNLSLRLVAARLAVSERELQRAFSAAGEGSFSEHLFEIRMSTAKRLLERGGSSRQVAAQVGYGSGAGFAKAFRRRYGVPPSAVSLRDRQDE